MLRAVFALILLVLGAVALSRGLYLRAELIHQLETGTMGYIRSWVMWSTTDGRELVEWYRMVTPWLVWGGGASLVLGLLVALAFSFIEVLPPHALSRLAMPKLATAAVGVALVFWLAALSVEVVRVGDIVVVIMFPVKWVLNKC